MNDRIQSSAGRGGDPYDKNNSELTPSGKYGGNNTYAAVIHVTASSVSNPDSSRSSTLFGMDSVDILHDYTRLFSPALGSSESDSLGIVDCVDGAQGAYVGGRGGTLSPQHGAHGQFQHSSPHQVRHSHDRSMNDMKSTNVLVRMQSTASSPASPFWHMVPSGPPMSSTVPGADPLGAFVGLERTHQHLNVRTAPNQVERTESNPPLSWAMRVSSPRQGWQQPGMAVEVPAVPSEDNEVLPEMLVGLDGTYESYCKQIITPALNIATTAALERLRNIQQEVEAEMLGKPGVTKATIPRKYFCSLKEVSKVAKICKLLVVAPDIKPSSTAHIKPVKMLNALIEDAESAGVPYVFALSRRGIGQIFGKDKNMSIMALMDLDPIRAEVGEMLEEARLGRQLWTDKARAEGKL